MPELLLELRSEEIPASVLKSSSNDLEKIILDSFIKHSLKFTLSKSFYTPRRLILIVENLDRDNKNSFKEIRGPRIEAPDIALQGFLKSNKLSKENLDIKACIYCKKQAF